MNNQLWKNPLLHWRRRQPTSGKAVAGVAILGALLVFSGMTVQSWREASERQGLIAECERRATAIRKHYEQQDDERADVVAEVKRLADETLAVQKETFELLESRGPLQQRIEEKVDLLRDRTSAAEAAARTAARAAAEAKGRPAAAAGAINESVRAVNRAPK